MGKWETHVTALRAAHRYLDSWESINSIPCTDSECFTAYLCCLCSVKGYNTCQGFMLYALHSGQGKYGVQKHFNGIPFIHIYTAKREEREEREKNIKKSAVGSKANVNLTQQTE